MKIEKDIATWDNLVDAATCNDIIARYHALETLQLSFPRFESPGHIKQDRAVFVLSDDSMRLTPDLTVLHPFLEKFWVCWELYLRHYSVLAETGKHHVRSMKIQKTLPGEGYHIWHFESDGLERCSRVAAWSLYLNAVDEGGETEFLYQSIRIPATIGTLAIWPATYTHVHRGNPPLSGEKYLLTGWIEW